MAELTFYRDPTTRLDSVSRSYKRARDSHQKQKKKKNGKKEPCQMIHEISSSRRLANQLIERMNVQTQTPHSGHKMWISGLLSHYYSSSSLCCADCCWARESTFLFASSGTIRHGSRAIRYIHFFAASHLLYKHRPEDNTALLERMIADAAAPFTMTSDNMQQFNWSKPTVSIAF